MSRKGLILIDGGYYDSINYFLRETKGERIDLGRLSNNLCEVFEIEHLRTIFYHAYPYQGEEPTDEEKEKYGRALRFFNLIDRLKKHQFKKTGRVRPNTLQCHECGNEFTILRQKGVDVGIAIDLIRMAQKNVADAFILVTGDEDFTDAVRIAKEQLCNVYVAFSSNKDYGIYASRKLTDEADQWFKMDLDFLEKCRLEED